MRSAALFFIVLLTAIAPRAAQAQAPLTCATLENDWPGPVGLAALSHTETIALARECPIQLSSYEIGLLLRAGLSRDTTLRPLLRALIERERPEYTSTATAALGALALLGESQAYFLNFSDDITQSDDRGIEIFASEAGDALGAYPSPEVRATLEAYRDAAVTDYIFGAGGGAVITQDWMLEEQAIYDSYPSVRGRLAHVVIVGDDLRSSLCWKEASPPDLLCENLSSVSRAENYWSLARLQEITLEAPDSVRAYLPILVRETAAETADDDLPDEDHARFAAFLLCAAFPTDSGCGSAVENETPAVDPTALSAALVLDGDSLAGGSIVSRNFRIDGRDHDLAGQPTGEPGTHGIATTEALRQAALAAIPDGRLGNITGVGPAPDLVALGPGPDLDALVEAVLAHPDLLTLHQAPPGPLGTAEAPVVVYVSRPAAEVPQDYRGVGILVADGKVKLADGSEWVGLVVSRSEQPEIRLSGNARILGGAAATGGPISLRLYNQAQILRSRAALQLALDALGWAP